MTREERIEWLIQDVWEDYRYKGYEAFKNVALKLINWADEHPKNPWMDAKTDPPKLTNTYYVRTKEGCADMAFYDKEKGIWYDGKITDGMPSFWMPIPEIPKGDKS